MILNTNEYLCLEGDKANTLFVVKSGMLVGSSKETEGMPLLNLGGGTIIGELSLLESKPRELTLRATEKTEILVIDQNTLQSTLKNHPHWIKSILTFLTAKNEIAKQNKRKNDLIHALPLLLYVLSSYLKSTGNDSIKMDVIYKELFSMNNITIEEIEKLLFSLQKLGVLKIVKNSQGDLTIKAESLRVIPLLYETLRYRALNKKVSANILSMTDQMVLTTFVKIAREYNIPLNNGLCTITTTQLKEEAKKTMHGFTLTSRTLAPLIENNLLKPSNTFDIHESLENIHFFYADFEKILDLLELNRVFPLLDKNLID